MSQNSRKVGRVIQGIVVSNKMNKTVVLRVDRHIKHPIYKKIITRSTRVKVHDEHNICNQGDMIRAQESPKYSKCKSWTLLNVIEKVS